MSQVKADYVTWNKPIQTKLLLIVTSVFAQVKKACTYGVIQLWPIGKTTVNSDDNFVGFVCNSARMAIYMVSMLC